MTKSSIELQPYKKALQLVKGEKLTGVHQIYYDLAENLQKLINKENSPTVQQYFNNIIQKILSGEDIGSEELSNTNISTLDGLNLFDLTNNHFINNTKKASKLIDQAKKKYDKYCQELLVGFKDILATYCEFQGGTGFWGPLRRLRKNHSYSGNYTQEKYQSFITLIDHLALLDKSGILVQQLLDSLNKKTTFTYQEQASFLDEIYLIFSQLQENYFSNLETRDDKIIKKLIEHYQLNDDARKKQLKEYYDYQVHKIGSKQTLDESFCRESKKLFYDIEQVRKETKESHDNFKVASEQLKDKIHAVAEELGLHFRIKKQKIKEKEDEQKNLEIKEDDQKHFINTKHNQKKFNDKQFYFLAKTLAECDYLISEKEQEDRAIRKSNKKHAGRFSTFISIGEAFVSMANLIAVYLIFPPLAIGLAVWWSALFINRLLFTGDSQTVLDYLRLKVEYKGKFYRKIFCDDDGKLLSPLKITGIIASLTLSLATGIVCGSLSYMQSFAVWPSIFGGISKAFFGFLSAHGTALTVLSMACAGGPAAFMAVGITFIFGIVLVDFIRKDQHKEIIDYVKEYFIAPWNAMGRNDGLEKVKHIAKCALRVVVLLAALAVTMIATIASMGVFYQQTLGFLRTVATASPTKFMKGLAQVATWINASISIPFQVLSTNQVFQPVIKRHTFAKLKDETVEMTTLSPLQKDAERARNIGKAAVIGTAIINGLGMGQLNKIGDASSLKSVHLGKFASKVNPALLSNGTLGAATLYSIGPNVKAGHAKFDQDKVAPVSIEQDAKQVCPFQEEKYTPCLWNTYKADQLKKAVNLSPQKSLKGG